MLIDIETLNPGNHNKTAHLLPASVAKSLDIIICISKKNQCWTIKVSRHVFLKSVKHVTLIRGNDDTTINI